MRVARHLGKLSHEQQERIMRRISPRQSTLNWEKMMAFRASIEKEIAPQLAATRAAEAEADCFQVRSSTPSRKATSAFATLRVAKPVLIGHEYTPEWWKEAELRERAARKA